MLLVAWSPLKHMYSYLHTNLPPPPPQKRLGREEPERIEEEDEDSLDDYQPLGGGTERSIVLYNSVPLPPHTHTQTPLMMIWRLPSRGLLRDSTNLGGTTPSWGWSQWVRDSYSWPLNW